MEKWFTEGVGQFSEFTENLTCGHRHSFEDDGGFHWWIPKSERSVTARELTVKLRELELT